MPGRPDSTGARAVPADRQRINPVLQGLHPCGQALRIVVRPHFDARLDDGRAPVELCGHEMHGCAGLRLVRLDGAPMRVQAGEFRQQRGMYV